MRLRSVGARRGQPRAAELGKRGRQDRPSRRPARGL